MSRSAVKNLICAGILPAVLCVGICTTSAVSAQGLDDLFQRPTDSRFASPADNEPLGPINRMRETPQPERNVARIPSTEMNQRADEGPIQSPSDMRLTDDRSGSADRSQPRSMAMQIRQARALAQMKSRIARLEAERWSGKSTHRPSWNPDPMTGSRFPAHNIIRVPVYVRHR